MAKLPPTILCASGEHFIASYLSGTGLVVALTRRGTPTTDMIVTSEQGGRSLSLQVKTGGIYSHVTSKRNPAKNYWVWRTGSKAADLSNDSHWYAFVFIGDWPVAAAFQKCSSCHPSSLPNVQKSRIRLRVGSG